MNCPDLYYETHGSTGPHVLLVHGIYSARSHWYPNLEGLTAFMRPVIVELYGHAHSPTPDDPACYEPERYIEQFERIREAVGAERWFTIGQSLGAGLTLRYGLAHPERVIAQAFTNSGSAFASPETQERMAEGRAAQLARIEDGTLPDPRDSPLNPSRNRRLTPEFRSALEADTALHSAVGIARTSMYTVPSVSLYGRGDENTVPTLMCVGVREERFAENRRYIEQHVAQLEVVELNGGHGVNMDVPADFNAAVRSFFERFIHAA
ncbi:MAG: alpha/beta hydrolase [Chloroflexi bacterium]|nr:alpha/beta hydrolase [Chloroflexota bacterium]MDA1002348.1 alpha/beta hydrolase [Chloroflexota bacterium]